MPVTNKAEAFPNAHRGDGIKKIARNTWRYTDKDGATCIKLHHTTIVREFPDGRVELNTGGYRTTTTKDRMNANLSGIHIYQNKGIWYVTSGHYSDTNRKVVPYYDGIILPDAFDADNKKSEAKKKAELALFKQINKFCRKIRDMKTLPLPYGGDCWICMMQQEKPAEPNPKSAMGYARDVGQSGPVEDSSHLLEHIKEGYVHGTLLVNALRWNGMRDQGISFMLGTHNRPPHDLVAGRVRRYLKRKLGVG